MQVVVLGAAGQLGREVVRALLARGHLVRAVVRRSPVPAFDTSVEMWLADARSKTDLCAAIGGCEALVNTIGAGTLRRNDVESSTTAAAVAAAEEMGVHRYIALSAGMVGLDWWIFKYFLRPLIFRNIVAEHCRVEETVKASALNWTIVRPPKLANGPPCGYTESLEREPRSFTIARADVADFIAAEIANNEFVRQAVFIASRRDS
jgi:uncharacterized protein YbjT (DUF2867 family)